MERSRFSAAMMRSVEVGIHRSAGGHTRAHLDPACAGAASAAAAEAEARLISSAAILVLVVVATAARRIRRGHTSRDASLPFPLPPRFLRGRSGVWKSGNGVLERGVWCSRLGSGAAPARAVR